MATARYRLVDRPEHRVADTVSVLWQTI